MAVFALRTCVVAPLFVALVAASSRVDMQEYGFMNAGEAVSTSLYDHSLCCNSATSYI